MEYNVQVLYDGSRGVFFTLNITKLFLNLFLNLLFSVGQQRQYQQQQRADFVIIWKLTIDEFTDEFPRPCSECRNNNNNDDDSNNRCSRVQQFLYDALRCVRVIWRIHNATTRGFHLLMHTYRSLGKYRVWLVLCGGCGCNSYLLHRADCHSWSYNGWSNRLD